MTTKKEKIDWKIIAAAIVVLGAVEVVALLKGINGTLLILVMTIIAGLAGWAMPQPHIK